MWSVVEATEKGLKNVDWSTWPRPSNANVSGGSIEGDPSLME